MWCSTCGEKRGRWLREEHIITICHIVNSTNWTNLHCPNRAAELTVYNDQLLTLFDFLPLFNWLVRAELCLLPGCLGGWQPDWLSLRQQHDAWWRMYSSCTLGGLKRSTSMMWDCINSYIALRNWLKSIALIPEDQTFWKSFHTAY